MNVSNSTGQNTGYRVVGAGGAMGEPEVSAAQVSESQVSEVCLKPGETEECQFPLPDGGSFLVTFVINGEEVASATFDKDPGEVDLYEDERGFHVRWCNGSNGGVGEIPI